MYIFKYKPIDAPVRQSKTIGVCMDFLAYLPDTKCSCSLPKGS